MRVEFLGTAGYHPNTQRHTSGILLPDAGKDDAFLLDAGTGTFRLIGRDLPSRLHIFLSHAHLDHTMGITFLYDVAYGRNLDITIYSDLKTLDVIRQQLFDSLLFPMPFAYKTREIVVGKPLTVAGVSIQTCLLTHPGKSLGYRFEWENTSLAYITDTAGDDQYFPLIEGVDFLIHECNFADRLNDIADASGHCTSSDLVRAARHSRAKTIVATHFNPFSTIDPLLEDDLHTQIPGVVAAADGMCLEF